jgi:hypothetical protein
VGLQYLAPPTEGHSDQTELRCDFLRYRNALIPNITAGFWLPHQKNTRIKLS